MTLPREGHRRAFDIRTLDGYTVPYGADGRPWWLVINETTFLPLFPNRASLDAAMKDAGIHDSQYTARRVIDGESLVRKLSALGIIVCINLHADGQGAWSFDPIYRAGDLQ